MITAVADENPASVYSLHVDDTVTRAVREALGAGKIRLAVRKNLGDADVIHDVDDADDKLRS
jgi:hypothetical protein